MHKKGIEKGIFEGKKSTFFDGIFVKSFNLLDYTNLISNSKSAEEAYNKIAKLASA